jgi:glycosyltransferase involved in cell wall biosynthesis
MCMEKSLVSIITPFKNTSLYIKECIDSIIQQDYQNWELICINDHSEDDSVEIVNDYVKKDSRITLIHSDGHGIIPAIQKAYPLSKGEFITRMDSDDRMPLDRISFQVNALNQSGRGYVSVGLIDYFCDSGELAEGFKKYESWLNELTRKGENFKDVYKECVIPSPGFMIHRDDFEKCGRFDSVLYPEDYDLAFRMYQNKLKVLPCNKVLLHWRDYGIRTSRVDEKYTQAKLLDLRLHYFLKLDHVKNKVLLLWGASKKGKQIAKTLIQKEVNFQWICDNENKIGQVIYDKKLLPFEVIKTTPIFQSIVLVANPQDQQTIHQFMNELGHQPQRDYFFFC